MWWRSRVWTVCIGFGLFLAVFCCPGDVIFFFDFFWLYTWSALLLEKLLHVLSAGLLCIPMTSVFLNLLSKLPLKDCVFCGASCMKGVRWVYYLHQKCIISHFQVPGAWTLVNAAGPYQHNCIGKQNRLLIKLRLWLKIFDDVFEENELNLLYASVTNKKVKDHKFYLDGQYL